MAFQLLLDHGFFGLCLLFIFFIKDSLLSGQEGCEVFLDKRFASWPNMLILPAPKDYCAFIQRKTEFTIKICSSCLSSSQKHISSGLNESMTWSPTFI